MTPLLALLLATADPSNVISRIDVRDVGTAVEVTISGSRAPSFTTFSTQDPPRFVVELPDSSIQGGGRRGEDVVEDVVAEQRVADGRRHARVTLAFAGQVDPPRVRSRGNDLVVRVAKLNIAAHEPTSAVASVPAAPAAVGPAAMPAPPTTAPPATEAIAPKTLAAAAPAALPVAAPPAPVVAAPPPAAVVAAPAPVVAAPPPAAVVAAPAPAVIAAPAPAVVATQVQAPASASPPAPAVASAAPVARVVESAAPVVAPAAPAAASIPRAPVPLHRAPPQVLREVGFRQSGAGSRVLLRTSGTPRYALRDEGTAVIVFLDGVHAARANDLRPLDTSFFPSAVRSVVPRREKDGTTIEIRLRERVAYRAEVEGGQLAIVFDAAASPHTPERPVSPGARR